MAAPGRRTFVMSRSDQHGNREAKKPKKQKPKTSAAAPSVKGMVQLETAKLRKK
jgi:hypothetical protein